MDEPNILEERSQEDDQMETKETIKLTEEELKTKLLNEIDEEDKKKFENLKARDILELTENQWKEIFETIKGIAYFNRISKLKVKTLLIKKNRNNLRKNVEQKEKEKK